MNKRILTNLRYFGFWVFYFFVARLVFLAFHVSKTKDLTLSTLLELPFQGLKLDVSFSAYLCVIPFLIVLLTFRLLSRTVRRGIKTYTYSIVFLISLLMFMDLGLYDVWGTRLDSTFLMFVDTPSEMLASITTSVLVLGIGFWLFYSFAWIRIFDMYVAKGIMGFPFGSFWELSVLSLMLIGLILPIRGGIQTIPINQSNVYFSDHMFANHAAVNFGWSFMKSLSDENHKTTNPFILLDRQEAKQLVNNANKRISSSAKSTVKKKVLNKDRPNIIFIVWESFTAKTVAALNGLKNTTPRFNELVKEGILFDQFYANGSRSDKGLVALMSGYYPQPDKSIMKMPAKSRTLPMLPKILKERGYSTSFYYGGNMNFGNMNTYFRNGVDHFIDGDHFENEDWNSKWGAHDHIVLDKYLENNQGPKIHPSFDVIFTLSSHEPFEFPDDYKFGENGETEKFKSAIAYSDKSIGNFIDEAKKQPWWDNTLVIITADHGHHLPNEKGPHNGPRRFQIPMLWLGGAVAYQDTVVSSIGSQVDVPFTLLNQIGIDNSDFIWSHDLFVESDQHFAHYIFTKGFGTIDRRGQTVYDYNGQKSTYSLGSNAGYLDSLGNAITQESYQDFLERR